MKVSPNFDLKEFIDPKTYSRFGIKSIWFIDHKLIDIAQKIRDLTQRPVTINDWHNGGRYKLSGLRPFTTSIGAKYSQHKFGRAIDIKVGGMSPMDVHQLIFDNEHLFIDLGLTTLESHEHTPTWTHLDCRYTGKPHILIVGL